MVNLYLDNLSDSPVQYILKSTSSFQPSGLEEIPEDVPRAYQKQKRALGGRGPRLSDIVKMLQATSSKERTFICIDALDECVPEHRAKLLDSLGKFSKSLQPLEYSSLEDRTSGPISQGAFPEE